MNKNELYIKKTFVKNTTSAVVLSLLLLLGSYSCTKSHLKDEINNNTTNETIGNNLTQNELLSILNYQYLFNPRY